MSQEAKEQEEKPAAGAPIDGYSDIRMRIRLEVGRRGMRVRDILHLAPGSVVDVPKSAGENIDIYINGNLVAFGEILEMEGKAGVRLTDFVQRG